MPVVQVSRTLGVADRRRPQSSASRGGAGGGEVQGAWITSQVRLTFTLARSPRACTSRQGRLSRLRTTLAVPSAERMPTTTTCRPDAFR
ncbi:MAG: hypothetical protein MUE51_07275 [Thermoleophilia bacterium]|nr:hypothetical protein [Thermoleophilia bacterium]